MKDGIIRIGSAAANGMAPSEMNDRPSSHADLPDSRSASENIRGRRAVASAIASGGTMPAAMTAAMIFAGVSALLAALTRPVVANTYATLLTGPPRSKHIIRPSTTPNGTSALVPSPPSQLVSPSLIAFIGGPTTRYVTAPTSIVAEQRDDHHGHDAPNPLGDLPADDPQRQEAREEAGHDAAQEAGTHVPAMVPPTKPGTMPGRSAIAYAM